MLGIRLNAALVTISACRSAGARTYAGEGLVGLTWAFLEAGAQNVIAGLWDVSDRSPPSWSPAYTPDWRAASTLPRPSALRN